MADKPPDRKVERTLRGVIVPVAWQGGRVVEAAISARDEKVYLVVDQARQKWLQENLHREIQASGPVTARAGKNYLGVSRWKLVDPGRTKPLEEALEAEAAPTGPAESG
jgi:hypothetical protein